MFRNYFGKLSINKNDLVIEPSAGNGSFINGIEKLSNFFKFYDIEPEHERITKQDYLLYDYQEDKENFNPLL